jgi:hypothetical protein
MRRVNNVCSSGEAIASGDCRRRAAFGFGKTAVGHRQQSAIMLQNPADPLVNQLHLGQNGVQRRQVFPLPGPIPLVHEQMAQVAPDKQRVLIVVLRAGLFQSGVSRAWAVARRPRAARTSEAKLMSAISVGTAVCNALTCR